ncbi:MAG TPA: SUF system NifU family Fe-S cluster assembly protein [Acidobacteriota bacterium]|nr:SUF system NifU family Fe-S cluster assembly protein [Acidobacteriota bacterium]
MLDELYQEVILDHNKSPRNFGELEGASHRAEGHNPLCGDKVKVYLEIEDGVIADIRFQGAGCAISTASASLMTEALKGKTVEDARQLFGRFHEVVTGKREADPDTIGKLAVFQGVQKYPVRVKCASLAWHTLQAALQEKSQPVTTES